MPDLNNPTVLKILSDMGIAVLVVMVIIFFELNTWKNREEAQRKDKCDLLKVLQDVSAALSLSTENTKQIKELLMALLGKGGFTDDHKK